MTAGRSVMKVKQLMSIAKQVIPQSKENSCIPASSKREKVELTKQKNMLISM